VVAGVVAEKDLHGYAIVLAFPAAHARGTLRCASVSVCPLSVQSAGFGFRAEVRSQN
jgi:hypothetical protein